MLRIGVQVLMLADLPHLEQAEVPPYTADELAEAARVAWEAGGLPRPVRRRCSLLSARMRSDRIGDWLGVVPYVVTLDEAIGGSDAAVLAEHFWTGIGRGEGAASALEAALAACAPVVAEYVVKHW